MLLKLAGIWLLWICNQIRNTTIYDIYTAPLATKCVRSCLLRQVPKAKYFLQFFFFRANTKLPASFLHRGHGARRYL
ncbi:hypothetical protein GGS20DRAFT_507194 [Poronia punctata]|nr:hypothetical protein GGS20DRAFT_507194 [Poronia punctata]